MAQLCPLWLDDACVLVARAWVRLLEVPTDLWRDLRLDPSLDRTWSMALGRVMAHPLVPWWGRMSSMALDRVWGQWWDLEKGRSMAQLSAQASSTMGNSWEMLSVVLSGHMSSMAWAPWLDQWMAVLLGQPRDLSLDQRMAQLLVRSFPRLLRQQLALQLAPSTAPATVLQLGFSLGLSWVQQTAQ